ILPFIQQDTMEIKNADKKVVKIFDYPINEDKNFSIKSNVFVNNGEVVFKEVNSGRDLKNLFKINSGEEHNLNTLKNVLIDNNATENNPYHAKLVFEKDKDKAQILENKGDGNDYGVSFVLEEEQSAQE